MGVRLCALAFLVIGCLLYGGTGVALAGDPASDDGYGQGAPAADPGNQDQPDATDEGGEDQPDATDEGGDDDQSDDGAMSPDDEGASPNDEAPQDDQPE